MLCVFLAALDQVLSGDTPTFPPLPPFPPTLYLHYLPLSIFRLTFVKQHSVISVDFRVFPLFHLYLSFHFPLSFYSLFFYPLSSYSLFFPSLFLSHVPLFSVLFIV